MTSMATSFHVRRAWRQGLRAAGFCGLLALGSAGSVLGASAPGAAIRSDNAEVAYRDISKLSETQRYPTERTGWLDELSHYLLSRASRSVRSGQHLSVTIDDVELAGMLEPWRSARLADVRIVRDTTPPRIDLSFRLESAQGEVLKVGERKLRNVNFLNSSLRHRGDVLSYEKDLIDDWVAKEFGTAVP